MIKQLASHLQVTRIFFEFLRRDFYVYFKRINTYAINFIILYPLTYIISFAYIQAKSYFGAENTTQATIFFAGNVILLIMNLAFEFTILLLFDLENERTIDYRITLLNPRLILLEHIVFTTLFSFLLLAPFFPITVLILRSHFDSMHISWPLLFVILFLSCLCSAAYHMFIACSLKNSKQIVHFWMRCNLPLITFGGFLTPWYIMNQYSSVIGKVSLLNPFLYATEGIRQAIIGGDMFFPITYCVLVLIIFSCIFSFLACYLFKEKMDHI
ncbi:MAG: ABC transporter permease [Candidatus Dependentiae bacterium]|nr:ABC transporter permease [Candidatus Dependentiae bacterium]